MYKTTEQLLFAKLSDISEKIAFNHEIIPQVFPQELVNYVKDNKDNKKAMVRLAAFLHLTMRDEFITFFIENHCNELDDKGHTYKSATDILYYMEEIFCSMERGDFDFNVYYNNIKH